MNRILFFAFASSCSLASCQKEVDDLIGNGGGSGGGGTIIPQQTINQYLQIQNGIIYRQTPALRISLHLVLTQL